MFDLEVQRFSRVCAGSGRDLQPGESIVSTLAVEGAQLVRRDYSQSAWESLNSKDSPNEGILAWWSWTLPDPGRTKPRLAPREVLLDFFEQLESLPDQQDTRYVLALLLLRRRILRDPGNPPDAGNLWTLECPSRDTTYRLAICPPAAERVQAIQAQLQKLLEGDDG